MPIKRPDECAQCFRVSRAMKVHPGLEDHPAHLQRAASAIAVLRFCAGDSVPVPSITILALCLKVLAMFISSD